MAEGGGKQGAVVISADAKKCSREVIKLILNKENDSELTFEEIAFADHKISACAWHLDTKYYETDIHFYEANERNLIDQEFADSIEAVILYFDNDNADSFNDAKSWLPYISGYDPEIKIIACNNVTENSTVRRIDVQTWSIDNGFELVELHPSEETGHDDDVEDSFLESNSFQRILEALSAHTWPELSMKSAPNYKPSEKFQSVLDEKSVADEMKRLGLNTGADATTGVALPVQEMDALAQSLENGAFEDLISHFQDIKSKAASLGPTERRKFAEDAALAFWNALGEDDGNDGNDSNSD